MERELGDFRVDGAQYVVVHNGRCYKAIRLHLGVRVGGDFATYSTQTRNGQPLLMTHALSGRGLDWLPVEYRDPVEYGKAAEHRRLVGEGLVMAAERDRAGSWTDHECSLSEIAE